MSLGNKTKPSLFPSKTPAYISLRGIDSGKREKFVYLTTSAKSFLNGDGTPVITIVP